MIDATAFHHQGLGVELHSPGPGLYPQQRTVVRAGTVPGSGDPDSTDTGESLRDHLALSPGSTTTGDSLRDHLALNPTSPLDPNLPIWYRDFADVFDEQRIYVLPPLRGAGGDFPIDILPGRTIPQCHTTYRYTVEEEKWLEKWQEPFLKAGIMAPCVSSTAVGTFLVKKSGGGYRVCHDYRGPNSVLARDTYPLPLMQDVIGFAQGGVLFSKFDLKSAYSQIRIRPGDEWKTAFRTHRGTFVWKVLPFGLANAPSFFSRFIFNTLADLPFIRNYLDDLISRVCMSLDPLAQHIRENRVFFARCQREGLTLNLAKCEMHVKEVDLLGARVDGKGQRMTDVSRDQILSLPVPTSPKSLSQCIGLFQHYRRYIPHHSDLVAPLTKLTRKGTQWEWCPEVEGRAWSCLREALVSSEVIRHPDRTRQFVVECDASGFGIGAVLAQADLEDPTQTRPCEFWSRKLSPAEGNYSIPDKELLAIVAALSHWAHLLRDTALPVRIRSDHRNLLGFTEKRVVSARHARFAANLMEFNYQIEHVAGIHNAAADALSRRSDYEFSQAEKQLLHEVTVIPHSALLESTVAVNTLAGGVLEEVLELVVLEPLVLVTPLAAVNTLSVAPAGTKYVAGKEIVEDAMRKLEILRVRHDAPTGGHWGRWKTLKLVRADFNWPGITQYVHNYVDSCDSCQRVKVSRQKPFGLLQPLPIPQRPFQQISIDLIVKLPLSNGFDSIVVVTCQLTKAAHFIPTTEAISAGDLAELVVEHVARHHGIPEGVVSDRGPQFASAFWRSFFGRLGGKPWLSSAFHPQTDGLTERINQTLETYLRHFCSYDQANWSQFLVTAEIAYNHAPVESTGKSPWEHLYGFNPRVDTVAGQQREGTSPAGLSRAIQFEEDMEILRAHLTRAQAVMKRKADVHRQPAPFQVGDKVWLSTRNLTTTRPSRKLDYRKIGPYRIIEKINNVAFRLQLPHTFQIHPVFHTSLLSPHIEKDIPGRRTQPLPPVLLENGPEWEVEELVDVRKGNRKGARGWEWLVRWKGFGVGDDSWETQEELLRAPEALQDFYQRYPEKPGPPHLKANPTPASKGKQQRH